MNTFVSNDGRVIEVIEKTIEIPYWSPLGRHVQISTRLEFRDTGLRRDGNISALPTNVGSTNEHEPMSRLWTADHTRNR